MSIIEKANALINSVSVYYTDTSGFRHKVYAGKLNFLNLHKDTLFNLYISAVGPSGVNKVIVLGAIIKSSSKHLTDMIVKETFFSPYYNFNVSICINPQYQNSVEIHVPTHLKR